MFWRVASTKEGAFPRIERTFRVLAEMMLSICTATGCTTAVSETVQRCLHFQRVSPGDGKVVETRVQLVIGREMSWLTLTAVQGSLRKSETPLDRPVSVLDRNASFSV